MAVTALLTFCFFIGLLHDSIVQWGRGSLFCHYYKVIAEIHGNHFRGGAVCVIVGPLLFSGSCSTLLNIMRISRDSQLDQPGMFPIMVLL